MPAEHQLPPEFEGLSDDDYLIWADFAERHAALEAVVMAWEGVSPGLDAAIHRVDRAVVAGLAALRLPRGLVRGVRIESRPTGPSGQKLPNSVLVLVGERMQERLRVRAGADAVFRTWVHESIHARQEYVATASIEYRRFRGYEEGLVEGLTRAVLRQVGIRTLEAQYDYYVAAYGALANVLGCEAEALWRFLWRYPTGGVRTAFTGAVETLLRMELREASRQRLSGIADTLFGSDRNTGRADETVLIRLWRSALL